MIIQFHKNDITFFDEDKAYFEKRISGLVKFLGNEAGDEDSVIAEIYIEKDKHHSGDKFHAKANVRAPHDGSFHAEADSTDIKSLADKIRDTLEVQMKKFHDKKKFHIKKNV